ncbi:MAG: MotA/TolQ/ExbB proton channel family protein [Candidatus Mcinerneyibacterium aminivorans]|uniref:MotA/TolQ/ExbB proton channel family protein n=1 Tax=Candidatus Mcinerneyibacterium aminivorans TaxID=2703815 RepID=A0A5D0MJF2_9BACT|nr:MAG: MotA/TolQ/ExbB proton channel family protein [Candidatus Mcinerneyibacterium aminivorans]
MFMNIDIFLSKSGIWGYPLLLLSIIALAIIIERLIYYIVLYYKDRKINIDKYIEIIENQNDISKIKENNYFNEILKKHFSGYSYYSYTKIKVELEKIWKNSKNNVKVLEFTVKVAPLLGILGTISGIIKSFIAVGEFDMEKKALVTSGISEALLTTEAGLIISVIVLLWIYIFGWIRKKIFSKYENFLTIFEAILQDNK